MREIIIVAHDMRSTFNVGSLFRTADGMGIKKLYLTGYTPYPIKQDDERLPHIAEKLDAQISKTALGATETVPWEYREDVLEIIQELKQENITLAALEQAEGAIPLHSFVAPERIALVLGTEVTGLSDEILKYLPDRVVIPMYGSKESLNVVIAAAMAMYRLRFH